MIAGSRATEEPSKPKYSLLIAVKQTGQGDSKLEIGAVVKRKKRLIQTLGGRRQIDAVFRTVLASYLLGGRVSEISQFSSGRDKPDPAFGKEPITGSFMDQQGSLLHQGLGGTLF